jgi:cytidylate kinase
MAEETSRIARRDEADSTRAVAPLRPAPDAVQLDTSALSFEEQVDRIVQLVRQAGLPTGEVRR